LLSKTLIAYLYNFITVKGIDRSTFITEHFVIPDHVKF